MPQMAPLSWLTLFLIFSLTLILFTSMNYFITLPPIPTHLFKSKTTSSTAMNWKW